MTTLKPKEMKKVKLAAILGTLAVSTIGWWFWGGRQEAPVKDYRRQELTVFKGVMLGHRKVEQVLEKEGEKMRTSGVNIVAIRPEYCPKNHKIALAFLGPPTTQKRLKQRYLNLIRRAHRQGLAVFLELNAMAPGCRLKKEDLPWFMENFVAQSLEWARIAEEEQVELFSPLNEPNLIFGSDQLAFQWGKMILPKIRAVYSGEVVFKLADMVEEGDFSGYDYLAFDVFPGPDLKEWRHQVRRAVALMSTLVAQYNLKGAFFGETGALIRRPKGTAAQLAAGAVFSESGQAQVLETLFEESWGRVKGYFLLDWNPRSEYSFLNPQAQTVIKKWYLKTNPEVRNYIVVTTTSSWQKEEKMINYKRGTLT